MILLFGFCARAITYRAPLLDHHAWRQADTAAISRNFFTESFNPLYPQVDWRGGRARGDVETGFEAVAFIVAIVAKATGRFQTEVGRLFASLLFIVSGWLFARFARRRHGEAVGLITAFVYAFGFPLALFMDRSFMNEPLLLCLTIGALASGQEYLESRRRLSWVLLAATTTLLGAIKLPFLIVWAPLAALWFERGGWRSLWSPSLLGVYLINGVAVAAWYVHAHQIGAQSGITFGMTDKLFDPSLVFSIDFVTQIARQLFKDVFGLTLLFFAVGTVAVWRQRRWCELAYVGAFIVYLLALARGNYRHDYYQLPIVGMAPVIAAIGVVRASGWLAPRIGPFSSAAAPIILGAILLSTVVRSVSANSWYAIDSDLAQACTESAHFLRPDDRLLFLAYSDPKLLFCMDKKGWLLLEEQTDEATMNDALEAGATVALFMKAPPTLAGASWADAHGTVIFENPSLVAYRLTR